MSSNILPPAPYQSPITNQSGVITPIWAKWIGQIYIQTGGSTSTSLSSLITTVATLSSEVTTLVSEVSALQSGFNGLSVGRQL